MITKSHKVEPLGEVPTAVAITLRFLVPRVYIHKGMTPDVDKVVLDAMAVALGQAAQNMKEGLI